METGFEHEALEKSTFLDDRKFSKSIFLDDRRSIFLYEQSQPSWTIDFQLSLAFHRSKFPILEQIKKIQEADSKNLLFSIFRIKLGTLVARFYVNCYQNIKQILKYFHIFNSPLFYCTSMINKKSSAYKSFTTKWGWNK